MFYTAKQLQGEEWVRIASIPAKNEREAKEKALATLSLLVTEEK